MTTRKATHPLSPTSTSAVRTITSALASEHAEAIQTLNEQTMKQACEWLLDDCDESEDKLLETYYKCESAWKVLQRQHHTHQNLQTPISPLPPGAPNLSVNALSNNNSTTNNTPTLGRTVLQPRPLPKLGLGGVTAATAGSASSNSTTSTAAAAGTSNSNSTMKVAKGGVIPMRRTAPMPPKVSRMRSTEASPLLSSSASSDALADTTTQNNKKQRLDNARAPPPSALNFLAKLNKDGGTAPGPSTGPSPPGPTTTTTTTANNTTQRNNLPPMKGQLHRRTTS